MKFEVFGNVVKVCLVCLLYDFSKKIIKISANHVRYPNTVIVMTSFELLMSLKRAVIDSRNANCDLFWFNHRSEPLITGSSLHNTF